MTGQDQRSRRPARLPVLALAWGLAGAGFWGIRARGNIPAYMDLHRWLDGLGVPGWVRNIDSDLLLIGLGIVIWALVRWLHPGATAGEKGHTNILADFGLAASGFARGLGVGVAFGLPMVVIGVVYAAITGGWPTVTWSELVPGLVIAPINEEFFYRGVLVITLWRCSLGSANRTTGRQALSPTFTVLNGRFLHLNTKESSCQTQVSGNGLRVSRPGPMPVRSARIT